MQYIALIYTDETQNQAKGPEALQSELAEYFAFNEHAKAAGAFLAGEALEPTATATSVRIRDGELLLTDGPFAETTEALGGFYLLECDDLDAAIDLARRIPAARYGTIEVRPIMRLPRE